MTIALGSEEIMTEPRVEAGDRALRSAIMEELGLVEQMAPCDGRDKALSPETIANLDKLIQSAMNAQERELREALREGLAVVRGYDAILRLTVDRLTCGPVSDMRQAADKSISLSTVERGNKFKAEAERLLAERGEGR